MHEIAATSQRKERVRCKSLVVVEGRRTTKPATDPMSLRNGSALISRRLNCWFQTVEAGLAVGSGDAPSRRARYGATFMSSREPLLTVERRAENFAVPL